MSDKSYTSNSEFPRWCPGCSRQVNELCHHFNCALKSSDEIDRLRSENARMKKALELAEDVLSRSPYSTAIWPNGMHPNAGISQIRAALQGDQQ